MYQARHLAYFGVMIISFTDSLAQLMYQARQLVYFGVMITNKQAHFSKRMPIYTILSYIQNKPFHNGQTAFPQ